MVLFWVDDCIFYAKDTTIIDEVIDSLKDEFLLEREEDMVEFLYFIFNVIKIMEQLL